MSWLMKKRRKQVAPQEESETTQEDSLASDSTSRTSLTPSQLDHAIRDMLAMQPQGNKCQEHCRGNPITSSGKRKQLVIMTSIVMIPMAVLTGLTANTFFGTVSLYLSSSNIRSILLYSVKLGDVIHYLQAERDMSALYFSDLGNQRSKQLLLAHYPLTDKSLVNLTFWAPGDTLEQNHFQSKDRFLNYLNRHRYLLDTLNQTVVDELKIYTQLIGVFVTWLYNAITEAQSGFIWRSLVAYLEVIITKENLGLERALGTLYFAGGFPSRDVYLWFCESQDIANVTFESAQRYSDLVTQLYEQNILRGNRELIENLHIMREEIRRQTGDRNKSQASAEDWFNNMTKYLELLLVTQRELAVTVTKELDDFQSDNIEKMIAISVVVVFVIILCPIIIYAVYSLTNEIQKYSITLAERTKALNKEKKRTDQLLYQMLPPSVAERLKSNMTVTAETFLDATVFFSDIHGFSYISSRSSPIQMVEMLNSLYVSFDDVIRSYDVYKVETIGDAYMIVSGMPKRNGRRHAAEIGVLSIDLMDTLSGVDIPHLPGTRFQLRIGCHTGQVVAGVVGDKMPRYCLFGETVSVAATMEALGKPSRIHVSSSTHEALMSLGGFILEEREDDLAKRDIGLQSCFRGCVRTYWLQHRIGLDRRFTPTRTSAKADSSDETHLLDEEEEEHRGKVSYFF